MTPEALQEHIDNKTLETIRYIDLKHDYGDNIHAIFDNCSNLNHISIESTVENPDIQIPDKFEYLPQLKYLSFSNSRNKKSNILVPSSIAHLPHLQELKIELSSIVLPTSVKWNKIERLYILSENDVENLHVIGELTSLVNLTICAPVTNLDFLPKLKRLKNITLYNVNVEKIDFTGCENLEDVWLNNDTYYDAVNEINGFDTCDLVNIHISNYHGLKKTPYFKVQDKLLYFYFISNFTKAPLEIFECPALEKCTLGQFDDDFSGISSDSITKLTISNCSALTEISMLANFPNLTNLSLDSLSNLHDISPLIECEQLKRLDLTSINLEGFPTLNNGIDSIWIEKSTYPEHDLEIIKKSKARKFHLDNLKSRDKKEFTNFVLQLVKVPLTKEEMILFFNYFSPSLLNEEREKSTIQFSKVELLKINRINYKPIFDISTQWIHEQIQTDLKDNPLTKEMKVAILGTIGSKKTKLKQRLAELKITFHSKIKTDTTHVVIGKRIKNFDQVEALTWITEKDLIDFLNEIDSPYLLETKSESEQNIENIRSLLLANDESALLGLELLKEGGVPKELLTELLFIHKVTEDKKVKEFSKKLLLANTGAEYKKALGNRTQFSGKKEYKDLIKQFDEMQNNYPEIDWVMFSFCFYQRFKKGSFFFFKNATEQHSDLRKKIFDHEIQAGVLNYQKILTENHQPYYTDYHTYKDYRSKQLPKEMFDYDLTELNLRSTFTRSILPEIKKLKNLKKLDCGYCMLRDLPIEISALNHLEELHLEQNEFSSFPMVIKELKNLKKLTFFENRKKYKFFEIDIPQEVRDALPNCEFITQSR